MKADIERELPTKKQAKLFVGMTDIQLSWYKNVLYTVVFFTYVLLKDIGTLHEIDSLNHSQLQDVLIKLQKVCNHPYLLQEVEEGIDVLYLL